MITPLNEKELEFTLNNCDLNKFKECKECKQNNYILFKVCIIK